MVCALALATPSSALAQSAGDDHYQDPFSGQPQGGGSGGGGSGGGGGDNSQASPQTAQSTPSSPESDTSQAQSAQDGALPRTGFEAVLPLAYGMVLVLSGAALRLGARSRPR